jgi:hypothetical protein
VLCPARSASLELRTRGQYQPFRRRAPARLAGLSAPLVLMAITDLLLGGYSVATPFIYLSFLITVWIGRRLQSTENP